ncbi:MAG: LysR family transcriptional regulator [Solibacillus sp.]
MEIKWLKAFIVAAEYENFRKASEVLYVTQPAVTNYVKRLEAYLQVELFVREGKAVVISAAGMRFLPIAKSIVAEYERGLATFDSWKQGYEKQLTIAAAPQIASSILPVMLKDFMQQAPGIEVLIHVVNSYEVIEEIAKGQADIGLTRTFTPQASLTCAVAFEEPVVFVVPSEADEEQEAALLQKYRLITHNHPVYWDDLLLEVNRFYPAVKTLKVNQIEVTKRFIEQGLGVSYLPYSMIEKELQAGTLKIIAPDNIALPISQTYIVTKVVTPEVAVFTQFLQEIDAVNYD